MDSQTILAFAGGCIVAHAAFEEGGGSGRLVVGVVMFLMGFFFARRLAREWAQVFVLRVARNTLSSSVGDLMKQFLGPFTAPAATRAPPSRVVLRRQEGGAAGDGQRGDQPNDDSGESADSDSGDDNSDGNGTTDEEKTDDKVAEPHADNLDHPTTDSRGAVASKLDDLAKGL